MFHIMLVLPGLIIFLVLLFIALSIVLFAVTAVVAALVGGTSVAVLIRNKQAKKLLLIGFCILFLVGILLLSPVMAIFMTTTFAFFWGVTIFIYVGVAALSVYGLYTARTVLNRIGRGVLFGAFGLTLVAALVLFVVAVTAVVVR